MVSAALIRRYRNLPLKYWKPIQTGIEQDDDSAEVQRLSGCGPGRVLNEGIRLPRPVSPHLAAKLSGASINIEPLISLGASLSGSGWIVEGAGGVLVPLNERDLLIDLIGGLRLPVLIVSRSGLGTINHTLLTIEALEPACRVDCRSRDGWTGGRSREGKPARDRTLRPRRGPR